MNYHHEDGILYVYQDNSLNLVQPFNPVTGEAFTTQEKALEWLSDYVHTFYGAAAAPVSITLNYEDEEFLFENKPSVMAGEVFSLLIEAQDSCTTTTEHGCKITVENENSQKTYAFKFKTGRATKNLVIDEPGLYNVYIEGEYPYEGQEYNKKVIVHERYAFQFHVTPSTYSIS